MKTHFMLIAALLMLSCQEKKPLMPTAQEIIDKSIEVSGGKLHNERKVSFFFRDRGYISKVVGGKKTLKRITHMDSITITDIKTHQNFERFFNDSLIALPDSMANRYANSVNSVHYFSKLPFGLNDPAVNKELLGESVVNGVDYYKVKVTFDPKDGGKDFDDIYVYWFDKATFKPDFLAYKFHVDGGGIRFREAYNERYIDGIRFVDYNNFKPKDSTIGVFKTDSLFMANGLDLLSKIELKNISVATVD